MWKGTTLRIFLLFDIGIILYISLLYLYGLKEGAKLKKRRPNSNRGVDLHYGRILIIYLALLLIFIIIGIVIMKYIIRGGL